MPPSTLHAAAHADVVGPDEPDDPIAEVRRALGGVQQADGVGVGADDEDRPADLRRARRILMKIRRATVRSTTMQQRHEDQDRQRPRAGTAP